MIFGGLQKNSLIDFPGKISCVLFTLGCNFDCPYCHNPELIKTHPPTPTFDQQWVYDFLEKRRHFLDGVVISGGEPTLQTDLEKVCCRIKEMGFPVKIDSNGSRPKVLERLIGAGLVDYLAMDIKTDPARYAPLIQKRCSPETIHRSIRIIMEAGIDYEFKTTCIRPLIDTAVIETIARADQRRQTVCPARVS